MAGNQQVVRPIAMFFGGLIVNAGLLEIICTNYDLLARPWLLLPTLLVYVGFLCLAVLYVPSRCGGWEQAVERCIGARAAWVMRRVIVPAWAFAWFAYLTLTALYCLDLVLYHYGKAPRGAQSIPQTLPLALARLVMIAPAASASLPALARWSVFLTKVSFAGAFGLALSTAEYVPDVIVRLQSYEFEPRSFLEVQLLLWVVPPLLLSSSLVSEHGSDRRALFKIMIVGIAVPMLFATLAALSTVAGTSELGNLYRKYPGYIRYAYGRPERIGWVKVLLLTFTLLTAARFAAHLWVRYCVREPTIRAAIAVTAVMLLTTFGFQEITWSYCAWQYAAMPFAPLTGVLCGAYVVSGADLTLDSQGQRWLLLAWIAGCVTTSIPRWSAEYPDYAGIWPAWVLLGWLVSFGAAYLILRIRKRSTA